MKILVLNAGSSSQKSSLYEINGDTLPPHPPEPLWQAHIDWAHHQGTAEFEFKTANSGAPRSETQPFSSRTEAIQQLLETLWSGPNPVLAHRDAIQCVGHRVVHGGKKLQQSIRVTADVKATIKSLIPLAPEHNPANLEGIEAIEKLLPNVPQVAAFDTAFHSQLPDAAAIYPGPYTWVEQDIRRYGFHGISHQYCMQRAAQILGRDISPLRLVNCHLGNGCSLAAIHQGHSVDTTMGFTPMEGLMMGSRSGTVDPGILLYLLRQPGVTVDQLDKTLNEGAGLKGISGKSGDMRQIAEDMAHGDSRAQLAFAIYLHRLRASIGAMLATLGGLDVLTFTAGVGENAAALRTQTCQAFAFLGCKIDEEKNAQSPVDQEISTPDSTVRVLVIHTQEEWAIAQDCWKLARQEH